MSKLTKFSRFLRRHISLRCEDLELLYTSQWPIPPKAYLVYRVLIGCYALATWIQTTTFYLTHELVVGKHNIFAFVTTWVYTLSAVHFIVAAIATTWFTCKRPSNWSESELNQSSDASNDIPRLKYIEYLYGQKPLERNGVHCNGGGGGSLKMTPFKRRRARSEGDLKSKKLNANLFQISNKETFPNLCTAIGNLELTLGHKPHHTCTETGKADCFTIDIEPIQIDHSSMAQTSPENQRYTLVELNPEHLYAYLEQDTHSHEVNPFGRRRFSLPSRNSKRWRRLREEPVDFAMKTDTAKILNDVKQHSTCNDSSVIPIFMKHTPSVFLKFSWILYEMSFVLLICISIFYFTLILPHILENYVDYQVDFPDASVHGVNTFLIIIDFIISAYPIRLLHFVFAQTFGLIYISFTLIFWRVDPSFNVIYDLILDWGQDWGVALGVSAGLVLGAIPILHIAHFGLYKLKLCLHRRE